MTPDRILAAIDPENVEFALHDVATGSVSATEKVPVGRHSTFSEALLRYADRQQLNLYGMRLYVAVAGAVEREVIRVTNGRWHVSRSGLFAMTGQEVTFLNDVSAIAHAILDGHTTRLFAIGHPRTEESDGCSIVVFADRGLGAAAIHRKSTTFVTTSEAGHAEYSPLTLVEANIARFIRSNGRVTYEEMMVALRRNGFLLRPVTTPEDDETMLANLLGRYCAMVALTLSAWNGIYLCGAAVPILSKQSMRDAFCRGFLNDGAMRTRLREIPLAIVEQRNAIMRGLAAFSSR